MENIYPQSANQSCFECVLEHILSHLTQRKQGGTVVCRKKCQSPGNIDCAKVEKREFLSHSLSCTAACKQRLGKMTLFQKDSFSSFYTFSLLLCLPFHMLFGLPKHISSSFSSAVLFYPY